MCLPAPGLGRLLLVPRMPYFMVREYHWSAPLLLLVAIFGCSSQPAAPLLSDSPVYRNASEGFRFLVPEGWTQSASSLLPPGKLTGEIFLVRYRVRSPEAGAMLQILCMNDDKSLDLEEHHAKGSFRAGAWNIIQPRKAITINKTVADRMIYKAAMDQREMHKHVTCFRQNGRVYSFVGLYWSNDEQAQQQIERAADSIIWDR